MDGFNVPLMDRRLQARYVTMMKSHMHSMPTTAAGPTAAVSASCCALAATQAAWRFLNNDRVTLPALAEPLLEHGRQAAAQTDHPCVLLVHDWSKLKYGSHASKHDTIQLTHEHDIGYELAAALLLSAADGSPLAPMQISIKTAAGTLTTDPQLQLADLAHIDQVGPTMEASQCWGVGKRLVHVIDREADSVNHYRQWDAAGHWFLVRGDDRRVRRQGRSILLSQLAMQLFADEAQVIDAGPVRHKGRDAQSLVVETDVTLDRPGRRRSGEQQLVVPGRPLQLRLVVSRIVDAQGKVLATWSLLTNVPDTDAAQIARWYHWRWRIESYFKLLKSHGQQIEHWQQETGEAIARRLLVAAMACVVVWELQRQTDESAEQFRDLLVRLSGRQMKRGCRHTAPALLAGLFVLLPMLELLNQYDGDLTEIRTLATQCMPYLESG